MAGLNRYRDHRPSPALPCGFASEAAGAAPGTTSAPRVGSPLEEARFLGRLEGALERARRHPDYVFAVLALQVGFDPPETENLGAFARDRLLSEAVRRLKAGLRAGDTVTRLEADAFAVLVDDLRHVGDAAKVAGRLALSLGLPFDPGGEDVVTSARIGIAVSASGHELAEDLLRDADTAMRRVPPAGGTRYEFLDRDVSLRASSLLRAEADLQRGLSHAELVLGYEPIVSLGSGRLAALQAQALWNHPTHGRVDAVNLLLTAEATGLVLPFAEWILREAGRRVGSWVDRFGPQATPPLVVPLPSRCFVPRDLAERVEHVLEENGLPGRLLRLEVAEGALQASSRPGPTVLARLKALNVPVCVDSSGGAPSLGLLKGVRPSAVRIGRPLVKGADPSEDADGRSILALAHGLGLEVIAEGVASREERSRLQELGCDHAQGPVFGRTLDFMEAGELIRAPRRW